MRVDQLMHGGDQRPIVTADTPMADAMVEMSRKSFGMTCVVEAGDRLMHAGDDCPVVSLNTPMRAVFAEMSRKRLGMTCVVDDNDFLFGVITDGDLRRHIEKDVDVRGLLAKDVMTNNPVTISRATLAVEALNIMESRHITSLVVVEELGMVAGVVQIHDLWRTEMF